MAKKNQPEPNYRGKYHRKTFIYQGNRYEVVSLDYNDMMRKYYEKKLALERGEIIINKNSTVKQWVEQWLEVDKKPTIKESSYNNLNSLLKNSVLPNIGHFRLCDVQRQMLQQLLNSYSGKSFSLVSKIKIYLKEIFNAAERDDYIVKNPARYLVMPETTKGTARILTDNEYEKALELCKTHKDGLWILLMLRCGLRRGETVPLLWSDIDLKKGLLNINKSVEFISGKARLNDSAKTEAGNRIIKIPPDVLDALKANFKKAKSIYVFTKTESSDLLGTANLRRKWNNFKRELDIALGATLERNAIIESVLDLSPGLRLHSLRHTAITKLVLAGADVKDVQAFAGHSDVQTTLNIYTHVDKQQAAERIYNIQFGSKNDNEDKNVSGTKCGTNG